MRLDNDSCTRALEARDARFDGVFFVGIVTTGIYCRPICPARTTNRRNRRFFSHAAAAERSGFRPCLRCRPELAPGRARVDAVPRLADAAAQRIAAGALNGRSVDALAHDLGVSGRQLRRALRQELGVSPLQLAQTHRLLLAKQLIADTRLPMTRVAFASGFQSLRRFNALFLDHYRLNPAELRRRRAVRPPARGAEPSESDTADFVHLTLAYRPPLAWEALLAFLALRATPGVEDVTNESYARTIRIDGHAGVVRIRNCGSMPGRAGTRGSVLSAVDVAVSASLLPVLMPLTARLRHLFDLDADPVAIERQFEQADDGLLRGTPRGVRVPGAVDGFELATRAMLGQQVTVKGATTLMARLTQAFGEALRTGDNRLTLLAPTAGRIAQASVTSVAAIGIPRARAEALHALAREVAGGAMRIDPDADVRQLMRQLTDIRGIGDWTAEYVAMRAVHWPDAFPSSDIVLQRNAGDLSAARLRRAAEAWRPWRAYAAMHLWSRGADREKQERHALRM